MKNLINLFIVPFFLFYSVQKEKGLALSGHAVSVDILKKRDRIMYLFFKVEKNSSGNEKIILQQSTVSEGKLKLSSVFDRSDVQQGDFIITIEAADGKEMAKQLLKDPLNPEMEVYEKEGISRHKASLKAAEFSVRFSYSENIRAVKIEKATEAGVILLFTQKL